MKKRKQFETWFERSGMLRVPLIDGNSIGSRNPDGSYFYVPVETAWQSWKAALATLKKEAYKVRGAMAEDRLSFTPVEGALECVKLYSRDSHKIP